jgi:hypothetical protein
VEEEEMVAVRHGKAAAVEQEDTVHPYLVSLLVEVQALKAY